MTTICRSGDLTVPPLVGCCLWGSQLSPSLITFYVADMLSPTELINRVSYAYGITVWVSGAKIPEFDNQINSNLRKIYRFLQDNSLLMSAPKSTVTVFTPYPKQAKDHPMIIVPDSALPIAHSPKILRVHLLSFP